MLKLTQLLNVEGAYCILCGRCIVGWLNRLTHFFLCGKQKIH